MFPANSPFVPTSVVTPYDASGKWVGIGNGVTIQVTATDQDYYASRPLPVQTLFPMDQGGARQAAAAALAAQGYPIDNEIDACAQSPMMIMYFRLLYGYKWVPTALGAPVLLPPGLSFSGLPSYDPNKPPPGSITVSVNKADYVSIAPPAPPRVAVGVVGPGLMLNSDMLVPPVSPTVPVWSAWSQEHYAEGAEVEATPPGSTKQGLFKYHLLGNELMSANQRIGVWLGPLPQ